MRGSGRRWWIHGKDDLLGHKLQYIGMVIAASIYETCFLSQVLPVGSSGQFLVKAQGNWGTRVNAAKNWYFWMNLKKKWIGEWKWNFDLVDACLQTSRLTMVSNNVYFATAKKGLKGCACAGVPGHYLQKPPGLQVLAAGWPRAP